MTPPSQRPEEAPDMPAELIASVVAWWTARVVFVDAAVKHLMATRHRQGLPETGPDATRAAARETERARREFAWNYPNPLDTHTSVHSGEPDRSIGA